MGEDHPRQRGGVATYRLCGEDPPSPEGVAVGCLLLVMPCSEAHLSDGRGAADSTNATPPLDHHSVQLQASSSSSAGAHSGE